MTASAVLGLVSFSLSIVFFVLVLGIVYLLRTKSMPLADRRRHLTRAYLGAGGIGIALGIMILAATALELAAGRTTLGESWTRLLVGSVFTVANIVTLRRWMGPGG